MTTFVWKNIFTDDIMLSETYFTGDNVSILYNDTCLEVKAKYLNN